MTLTVLKAGLMTTVQDRGRFGYADLGVGSAGPMDDAAMRLGNALVGNRGAAAVLEFTLLGPILRFEHAALIAVTGADHQASIDGAPIDGWRACRIGAGSVLDCGGLRHGARAYLAIAGGFDAPALLGSRSTDVNAWLGSSSAGPVRVGDRLTSFTPDIDRSPVLDRAWSIDPRPWFDRDLDHPVRLIRGAHFDALDDASRGALFSSEFRIGAESNRVGLRLAGPPLRLLAPLDVISEPVAFGTLQLPPSGQPIALMAEHPTVGGYPRIGQIAAIDLPRIAQRRPGEPVRFREIGFDDAQKRYLARERELSRLIEAIDRRLHP